MAMITNSTFVKNIAGSEVSITYLNRFDTLLFGRKFYTFLALTISSEPSGAIG